jgi:hypothetical protein
MPQCGRPFGIVRALVVATFIAAAATSTAVGQTGTTVTLGTPRFALESERSNRALPVRARQDDWGRFGDYVNDLVGPWALVGIVGRSGVDQAREDPEAWGDDSDGFSKRLGSNAGRRFVQATVHHSLAAALGRTTDYHPCGCTGLGGKLGNSFLEAVTDHDAQGRRLLSVPQLAGNYAGAFAQLTWRPDGDAAEAAINGTLAIGFTAAGNFLLTEVLGFGR